VQSQPQELFPAATSTTKRRDEFCLGRLLWVRLIDLCLIDAPNRVAYC
jgi:hypothetical protein